MPVRNKKQRHFSWLKLVLVLLILLLVGGTGYYVYISNKRASNTLADANKITEGIKPIKASLPPASVTANWTIYSNQEGLFSLKYPATWVQQTSRKLCPAGYFDRALYIGPDSKSVIKCPALNQGQVYVASYLGDQTAKYALNSTNYKNITIKHLDVSGVPGVKTTGLLEISGKPPLGSYPNNSFTMRYIFFTNGNTYVAQYVQAPNNLIPSKNVHTDFELIVNRTLKFRG